jgi:hypothetical protein
MVKASSTRKKKPAAPQHKLDWEYCECGCHCHVAKAGSMFFSMFGVFSGEGAQRRITSQELFHGHRGGQTFIGSFDSFDAADRHAGSLARANVESELKRIKADAQRLGVR